MTTSKPISKDNLIEGGYYKGISHGESVVAVYRNNKFVVSRNDSFTKISDVHDKKYSRRQTLEHSSQNAWNGFTPLDKI